MTVEIISGFTHWKWWFSIVFGMFTRGYPIHTLTTNDSAGTNQSLLAELHAPDPLTMLWHLPSFAITAPRVNSHTTSSINGLANLFSTNKLCPNNRATWDPGLQQSHQKTPKSKEHDPHHEKNLPHLRSRRSRHPHPGNRLFLWCHHSCWRIQRSPSHPPQRPSKRRRRLHPLRPTCTHSHCLPSWDCLGPWQQVQPSWTSHVFWRKRYLDGPWS